MCTEANMYDVTHIKNYILFLKRSLGLSITLHPCERESLIVSSELMTFNIHENPYCIYVKSFPHAHEHCVRSQSKVLKKCDEGSFCGSCFAGVREFVYPITNGNELLGFISVSGYASDNMGSYIKAASEKYFLPPKKLFEVSSALKSETPDKKEIDTLIIPLCNMLELAYLRSENDGKNEEALIDSVIRYIKHLHTKSITLDDVCKRFSCSRSYISHSFKRYTGRSFREYLTDIRLDDARSLLRYSKLNITEIALSVGFSDSAYFSNVFKRRVGVSPAAYRKAKNNSD